MYQNPAPYSEQILTYSTALAFTGRSAACAPPTASRAAAEPRTRLLIIFMSTSKLLSSSEGSVPTGEFPSGLAPKTARSFRNSPPHDGRIEKRSPNGTIRHPQPAGGEYACAIYIIKIVYFIRYSLSQ